MACLLTRVRSEMSRLDQVTRNFPGEDGKRMMTQAAPTILCDENRKRYQKYTVIPCCTQPCPPLLWIT